VVICESCKNKIEPGSEFIVEGFYPKAGQIFAKSQYRYRIPPEAYGKIYHKNCFVGSKLTQ
jgi:hypothetical protein